MLDFLLELTPGKTKFIIATFVVAMAGVWYFTTFVEPGIIREHAAQQAHEYVRVFHPTWVRPTVACQADGHDHYVSCTLAAQGERAEPIECAEYLVFSQRSGCRLARQTFVNGNPQ